jgi:hypothetical protein
VLTLHLIDLIVDLTMVVVAFGEGHDGVLEVAAVVEWV